MNVRCRPRFLEDHVRFQVWAPGKKSVELVVQDKQGRETVFPMEGNEWGYFSRSVPDLSPGTRYGYRLDHGPTRPDPCTLWQPDGVHHLSALFDVGQHKWTNSDWQPHRQEDLVIYELHVGTFTEEGTFAAIIPRLPELKRLGITALEILPVAQFPGERNWGYDGVHPFAVQNSYGGPEEFQAFIDAAHGQGFSVILDVVYNHLGPEGNYLNEFGPYFTGAYSTSWGEALNFDGPFSDPVRQFFLENVWHWIHDFRLDGLRLDAVHAIYDQSPVHILREIKEVADDAAAARGSTALIIAESLLNDVRMLRPPEQGGYGLDAEWNEDFHHAVQAFLTGEETGKYVDFGEPIHLKTIFEENFSLAGRYSHFRRRRFGASAVGLDGLRFVAGIQNHDHIGNRAHGERLTELVSPEQYRLAVCLSLLSPFLPMIFMGEEYGESNPFPFFCSFEDERLIRNVRRGRKRDFGFGRSVADPQASETYQAAKLGWNWEEDPFQTGIRLLYGDLLKARREWPVMKHPTTRTASLFPNGESAEILEWKRVKDEEVLLCLFNLTGEAKEITSWWSGDAQALFRSEISRYVANTKNRQSTEDSLQPYECLVLSCVEK